MNKDKAKRNVEEDAMRPEYDFSKATRGATAERYAQGTNVVLLDPDVVRMFPNATAVNEALRALGEIIERAPKSQGGRSKSGA